MFFRSILPNFNPADPLPEAAEGAAGGAGEGGQDLRNSVNSLNVASAASVMLFKIQEALLHREREDRGEEMLRQQTGV